MLKQYALSRLEIVCIIQPSSPVFFQLISVRCTNDYV